MVALYRIKKRRFSSNVIEICQNPDVPLKKQVWKVAIAPVLSKEQGDILAEVILMGFNEEAIHSTKSSLSREEVDEFKTLADAIIIPAAEILPKTYDEDYSNYYKWVEENL